MHSKTTTIPCALHRHIGMALAALILLAPMLRTARAQSRRTPWKGPFVHQVSPALDAWFRLPGTRMARGRFLPGGPAAARTLERVHVTIRLTDLRSLHDLVALEDDHLRLVRFHGQPARLGTVVCAQLDATGLARLRRQGWVARVELDMRSWARPPLDLTMSEIHADAVWTTLDSAGLPITGHGVTIADLDSPVDVMHPLFFHADGGYFAWIDVDENGAFDPGVDAVDLNGDGLADAEETLQFFDGVAYNRHMEVILDSDNGQYDLGLDHLYADANGNGVRDFGPEGGFDDTAPAFGEVLLLPDDVNGNGTLDPGEKLVALGSSKIRAIYDARDEYLRGVNLATYPPTDEAGHGTGVAGILVGGNRGLTRWVGVAPDAELLMTDYFTHWDGTFASLFTWAVAAGADVVLHEYAPWVGHFLDGSSNYEQMLDAAAADGVAQINPAGNLGGSKKHCLATVPTRSSHDIVVALPGQADPEPLPYTYLGMSFLWRQPQRNLRWSIRAPGGEETDLGLGSGHSPLSDGTTWIYADRDDSTRGTAMVEIQVYGSDGVDATNIAQGSWTIRVTDTDGATGIDPAVMVVGWVRDDVSGWALGSEFATDVSEAYLIGYPGTADSAITVAAYTAHDEPELSPYPESRGELRRYSGRGRRIDDTLILDIGAPANPMSAQHRASDGEGGWQYHGDYNVFGGTSGAGPHVAGTAALLKQLNPGWTGLQVREAIRDGALVDGDVTADATHPVEELWGAGKLRVHAALYGQTPAANTAPTITMPPSYATLGQLTLLRPEVEDAEDVAEDLQVYWDVDYDGTWELGPDTGVAPRGLTFDTLGEMTFKARVVDTGGLTAETLVVVTVVDEPLCDGAPCPPKEPHDGCGCQGAPTGSPLPVLLLVLLGLWLQRRRSRN